jgi:predicted amidohydrolase
MPRWKIAAVQMDCAFADKPKNLDTIRARLREAAANEAQLVIFPECALPGYCFESLDEAKRHAEPITGPSTQALADECAKLGVWAVVGLLECEGDCAFQAVSKIIDALDRERMLGVALATIYNACALIGPAGIVATYRKIHLPFLGVDRFTTPGDQPFAVHDVGGLRIGMNICYDGSFPESARCLMLLGADLIVLPTNWPTGAISTAKTLIPARALENHVYYAAVNRVGTERGFRFIGMSRIIGCSGEFLAVSDDDQPTILYAEIDPEKARNKHLVNIPGKYELHRTRDRRPRIYGPITEEPRM